MYYIYILKSLKSPKFYVGYSGDPWKRLYEHNNSEKNTFTSKYRTWELIAVFEASNIEGEAIRLERFIKKQKSRSLLEKLCDPYFVPEGNLAQLIRVPHVRDTSR